MLNWIQWNYLISPLIIWDFHTWDLKHINSDWPSLFCSCCSSIMSVMDVSTTESASVFTSSLCIDTRQRQSDYFASHICPSSYQTWDQVRQTFNPKHHQCLHHGSLLSFTALVLCVDFWPSFLLVNSWDNNMWTLPKFILKGQKKI